MKDAESTLSQSSPMEVFDVGTQLESLRRQDQAGQDRTIILLKTDDLRLIFRALSAGATLPTHKAPGPITVQVLEGHIEFTAGEQTKPVRKGEVLALDNGAPHSVKAVQHSAILITVAVRPQSA